MSRIERARFDLGSLVVIGSAVAGLLLRTRLAGSTPAIRSVASALVVGTILVVSLVIPTPGDRTPARLARWAGLGVGLAAIAVATLITTPLIAVPFVRWALPLAILAGVAEEALFRRLTYGWLSRRSVALAVVGTAVLFALIHVPIYGTAVFPVDLGAGLLLSWQRWATGDWKVPAATHAAANALATVLR